MNTLKRKKTKSIDPEKDKKPVIVVAVDEASVIFGAKSSNSSKKKSSDEARELCEEIAKLGRASGIHLVLATQRATKTSIDTATLDNLEGRLCFRTRSVSGSNAILGTKKGVTLPAIPGRAIWQKGTQDLIVQVPFLSEKELTKKCFELCKEYKNHYEHSEVKTSNQKVKVVKDLEDAKT